MKNVELLLELEQVGKRMQEISSLLQAGKSQNPYLRLLSANEAITIAPCDGSKTFEDMAKVFKSFISKDFEKLWKNKTKKTTIATPVTVFEMAQNATSKKMFE